jgi:tetratricopeptide (TPR) repeat protein
MKMKNNLFAYGFLLTLLCAGPNAFAADSANLAKAESLIRAQKYEEAYNLLEPEEFDQAGNLKYDYLLGLAALYSNRPDKATLVFERVLAVNPNYLGVRLDNGRAYYAMGDFARASQEFQTVLTQNPPADIRKQAQDYLAAMQKTTAPKKLSVTAYLEGGMGRDSNVSSANSSNPVLLPSGDSVSQTRDPNDPVVHRDKYLTWAIGSEINYQVNDSLGTFAGVDTRYRDYSKQNPSAVSMTKCKK